MTEKKKDFYELYSSCIRFTDRQLHIGLLCNEISFGKNCRGMISFELRVSVFFIIERIPDRTIWAVSRVCRSLFLYMYLILLKYGSEKVIAKYVDVCATKLYRNFGRFSCT